MVVTIVQAGVFVDVLVPVRVRVRSQTARAEAAEAEQTRLIAELLRRKRDVLELQPFRECVERAPDWIGGADRDGGVSDSTLPVGSRIEPLGVAGVVKRGERTVDRQATALENGRLGIDRDMTERVAVVSRPVVDGSDEIAGALLRHEGRRGPILGTVMRYEQGRVPTEGADPGDLADASLDALRWADDAGRWRS